MTQKQIEYAKLNDEFKLCFSNDLIVSISQQEPSISLIMKNKKVKLTTSEWMVLSQSIETTLNFYLNQNILMYPKHNGSRA